MRSRACEKGRSFHSGLRFLFRQPVPFEGEQELFARQTAGVTGQLAARTDDPMAGNDDRNRIVMVGTAYGPRSHWIVRFFINVLRFRRKSWFVHKEFP